MSATAEVSTEDLPRAFGSKPPWQRILVMLAGPAANIMFAIVVLWAVFWNAGLTFHTPVVGDVILGVAGRCGRDAHR